MHLNICSRRNKQTAFSLQNIARMRVNIFLSIQNDPIPGPLPLGVAVIDSSVRLYGLIFPRVAHKHRYQMLQHFNECIKQAKSSRQQAVQMNIFTAVLCALKVSSEENYGKCSKILNTILILFSSKMFVI